MIQCVTLYCVTLTSSNPCTHLSCPTHHCAQKETNVLTRHLRGEAWCDPKGSRAILQNQFQCPPILGKLHAVQPNMGDVLNTNMPTLHRPPGGGRRTATPRRLATRWTPRVSGPPQSWGCREQTRTRKALTVKAYA
ncbi:hypothetical protein T484DRAFT_2125594 [Baffinella frigidus]|nr:hypothetical protein T484DRAFT_2125594 [Cryptophyta sp. CCMP2293]